MNCPICNNTNLNTCYVFNDKFIKDDCWGAIEELNVFHCMDCFQLLNFFFAGNGNHIWIYDNSNIEYILSFSNDSTAKISICFYNENDKHYNIKKTNFINDFNLTIINLKIACDELKTEMLFT